MRSWEFPAAGGFLQDYRESFYYHTLCQKQELWARNVGLFLFGGEDVTFFRLDLNFRTKPVTASVREGKTVSLKGDPKGKDQKFHRLIEESLKEELYSSIYLVGEGFDRSWAQKSTAASVPGKAESVCPGTICLPGAPALPPGKKVEEKSLKNYLYAGDALIRFNVGMDMKINGCPAYYPLVTAGVNWYETEKECEFLLEGTSALVFVVSSMEEGKRRRYGMALPGLPERPDRATRIRLHVEFDSPDRCRITAEDLGLGELFPASGKVWQ